MIRIFKSKMALYFYLDSWKFFEKTAKLDGYLLIEEYDTFSIFRTWQRRYFVLDRNAKTLLCYEDDSRAVPLGFYYFFTDIDKQHKFTHNGTNLCVFGRSKNNPKIISQLNLKANTVEEGILYLIL